MRLILLVALCCAVYLATAAPQSPSGTHYAPSEKQSSSDEEHGLSGEKQGSSGEKQGSSGEKQGSSGEKQGSSEEEKGLSGHGWFSRGNSMSNGKSSDVEESSHFSHSIFPLFIKGILRMFRRFMPTAYAILRFFWNWIVSLISKVLHVIFPGPLLTYIINIFKKSRN